MNFLEKDLETIIWENFDACEARGLSINQPFYRHGKLYRQLNLAPYGIADLVQVHFSAGDNLFYVQVVELKKGKVDTAAYLQAKRYQTALLSVLDKARKDRGLDYKIVLTSVLIGSEVETAGDFIFCLNADYTCIAFTYNYGFDGIAFEQVGKEWVMTGGATSATLLSLTPELLAHRAEMVDLYADYVAAINTKEVLHEQKDGDYSQSLLITQDGVLLNMDLLGLPDHEEEEGGGYGAE